MSKCCHYCGERIYKPSELTPILVQEDRIRSRLICGSCWIKERPELNANA